MVADAFLKLPWLKGGGETDNRQDDKGIKGNL